MVYGVTGAGKSTYAAALGRLLDLPVVAVDELTWQPGPLADPPGQPWQAEPLERQREVVGQVCAGDDWIIDHGYGSWLDIPLARVELIVGLDFSRLVSLNRLIRRCLRNIRRHTPICHGNVETWGTLVGEHSIVRWHFHSFARKRARIRGWAADPAAPRTLVLRSPGQAAKLLEHLTAARKSPARAAQEPEPPSARHRHPATQPESRNLTMWTPRTSW